jgi:hypothetical protein
MDSDLQARISDLEDRARRFKLATTGMEGWENYFQNLIMLERDYFFDVMSETLAQFHRDILDEAKAAIDQALARKIRGTWTPQAKYSVNDLVAKEGGSFVARKNDPGPCPGDDWQLIARQR